MFRTVLMATTALAVLAGSAAAQQGPEPQWLRAGAPLAGVLERGDLTLGTGEFYDAWTIQARAGDRVSLRMSSTAFDPYLMIQGPGDFSEQNDDAATGSTDAGLDLTLPTAGTYRVQATSFKPGEAGRYTLSLGTGGARAATGPGAAPTAIPPPALVSTRAILQPGRPGQGELRRGDDTLSSGEYADPWRFHGRRGQTYTIILESSDFDPYLVVRGPGGLSEDNDDDPSRRGSSNSRVTFTMSTDGDVNVSATSYKPGETGRYTVSLSEGGQVYSETRAANGNYAQNLNRQPQQSGASASATPSASALASAGPIAVGETRDGRLGQGAPTLTSGEFVNSFTLRGRQGQQLDLRLSSTEFDPYVQITGPNGFSAFNDDDADREGSHDSRLIVTLPTDGAYTIAATSYEAGESGRYRLSVADGAGYRPPAPPHPTPGPGPGARPTTGGLMRIGDTVGGELQRGDGTLSSGEYVDSYRFQATRGQRVAVELTSSAFDAYTILRTPSGEQIDNDDGQDGTNSRLDTVLSETGEYQVQVTSYSPGETGSYRFSVTPSQGSPRQAAVPGGPRVFAIMVGVSDYGDQSRDLPYTDDDAAKLADTLRREGVLNPASVTLTNAEATVAGVRQAFQRVAQQAGPDDMFLFFFSGHGDQSEASATEVSPTEPDGRSESIVLRDGEITDYEMARLFGTLRTRLSMLVLDSCFSGGFARNVVDRPGVMGLFSSEEDLTSAVADKFEAGGYLAHFLRTGLAGDADGDGDQMVTAGELATYLRRQFTTQVENVEAETAEGQRNYQNLVIDRGGVQIDDVILRLNAPAQARGGH
jgi:hypothetical protein